MESVVFLAVIVLLFLSGAFEYYIHLRKLRTIPIRIHVNGTRGKSSVTRLIAAGLREAGIRTYAKTTGSTPRVIIDDGSEYPVYRKTRPNIIEQLRIIAFAADNNAQAIVIECMALQPFLQHLSETKMLKSTHGVITNVREDHLDIMGPSEKDVALALLGTVPFNAKLFTAEKDYTADFIHASQKRKSELLFLSDSDIEEVKHEEMEKFSYVEHRENVALALKVCNSAGVDRETAIRGMWKAAPDAGATSDMKVDFFGRQICFVNGFAANDPESTEKIWNMSIKKHQDVDTRIMIINSRSDRPDRSRQIGEALSSWPVADKYILIGSGSYFLAKYAVRNGINPGSFIIAEDLSADNLFEEIINNCGKSTLVAGVGNIKGAGFELIKYFRNRSKKDN